MTLLQMQRQLNQLKASQPENRLVRLALNRLLEAKRGLLHPDIAKLAYQACQACQVGQAGQALEKTS